MRLRDAAFTAALAAVASATLVNAQPALRPELRMPGDGAAGGPVLGFVPGRAGGIRAVLGVAGAATVGAEIDGSRDIESAIVSPSGDYAVALTGSRREASIWMAGRPRIRMETVPAAPDAIALSPEGSAAAFFYSRERRILIVTGLPEAPRAAGEVSAETAERLIVSDDGQLVMTAEAGIALTSGPDGFRKMTEFGESITAMAFAARRHDAVIVSGSIATLIRREERQSLPVVDLGPVSAAAWSSDGLRVLLASQATGKIAIVGPKADAVTLDCHCAPDGLFRMNRQDDFRLTAYSGGPVSMLESSATHPRIVTIP